MAMLAGLALAAEPPDLALTEDERIRLVAGETVVRSEHVASTSSGMAMRLVPVDEAQVWDVILDFDHYVQFLPYVTASAALPPDSQGRLGYRLELTTKGVVTRFETRCTRDLPDRMQWEMTPIGYSGVEAARGWWHTQSWTEGSTLLIYVADVDAAWWVPDRVHRKAADRGLDTMVELVGRQAVKRAQSPATVSE